MSEPRTIADFTDPVSGKIDLDALAAELGLPREQIEWVAYDWVGDGSFGVRMLVAGSGRRARFEARMPFRCKCGEQFTVSPIGLSCDHIARCPNCGYGNVVTQSDEDHARDGLSEALIEYTCDLDIPDPTDEEHWHILEHGCWPARQRR